MAIAFRNKNNAGSATGDVTITKPTDTADGDLLIFVGAHNEGFSADVTLDALPSGFAQATNSPHDAGANYSRVWLATKVAGGSEPANYTFGTNRASDFFGVLLAYSGVDTTTPFDATEVEHTGAASTTQTVPSITSATSGAMLLNVFAAQDAIFTTTPNGSMTEREDASYGSYCAIFVADETLGGAGASGTRAHTISASAPAIGWAIALRPASAGGSIVPQAMANYRMRAA